MGRLSETIQILSLFICLTQPCEPEKSNTSLADTASSGAGVDALCDDQNIDIDSDDLSAEP